jgi:hypothetical protein
MTVMRMFGLVSVLIVMAISAKSGMLPFGSSGSGSNASGRSPLQQQIDRATFVGAAATLDAYHAGTATYLGAPAVPGVTVVRADTASYCIQAQAGTTVEHELGPGGTVLTGPC